MALRLVRQTSDTPNITNKDDTIMTRYAYGGYSGIVKGFGSECEYTAENGIFKILDGEIIIDGWEIQIDGVGWTLDLHNVIGIQYHSVYAEINVLTETVILSSTYLTASYPEIEKGDDLTETPNGTARLLLYNVKVESGAITEVVKRFEIIPYLSDIEKGLRDGTFKPKIAQYASEDTSKGTIEERLTALGFRPGVASYSGFYRNGVLVGPTTNSLKKQGKYVIFNFQLNGLGRGTISPKITIPEGFRPKTQTTVSCELKINQILNDNSVPFEALTFTTVKKDGTVNLNDLVDSTVGEHYTNVNFLNVGWETE